MTMTKDRNAIMKDWVKSWLILLLFYLCIKVLFWQLKVICSIQHAMYRHNIVMAEMSIVMAKMSIVMTIIFCTPLPAPPLCASPYKHVLRPFNKWFRAKNFQFTSFQYLEKKWSVVSTFLKKHPFLYSVSAEINFYERSLANNGNV